MTAPVVVRRTNTLAILALVAAFVASAVGVILGVLALGQLRTSGESGRGRGLAIAAIVIGLLVTAFFVFAFALPYVLNA